MKASAILLFPGFFFTLFVAAYAIKIVGPDDLSILGWALLVAGFLLLTWLIATVFNLAIFAPV